MYKNILKISIFFVIGMVGGIFADQIFWPYFIERPLFYKYNLSNAPVYVTETKQVTINENSALTDSVNQVERAVVGVRTQAKNGIFLEGSGLMVTSDGLMVTLAELFPLDSTSSFFIDGDQVSSFKILKRDAKLNLILIKLDKSDLKTAGFADLSKIQFGQRVFLVGMSLEKKTPTQVVNEGIIRSFDENQIQTNIVEKNTLAGSPLFNISGEVLGLNTLDANGKISAIPISKLKDFAGL